MISFVASSHRPRRSLAVVAPLVLFLLAGVVLPGLSGCKKEEGVTTYTVDRTVEEERRTTFKERWLGKPGRLIGVILPHGDETWFFKILGPDEDVKSHVLQVKSFISAVKFEGTEPVWSIPESWKRSSGDDFSFAAFALDDDPKGIKLTVSRFPGAQDITENINRWRKQVKLPAVDAEGARRLAVPLATGGGEALWVELTGYYNPGAGMRGPFAGGDAPFAGGAASRPQAGPIDPNAQLPAGHPEIGAAPKPGAKAGTRPSPLMPEPEPNLPFTYELPEGWSAGEPSQFVMAAFTVSDGTSSARITVSQAGGDMLANINRWRGELRLPSIEENQLLTAMTKVKLSGLDANYIELIGTANSGAQEATLGVAAPNGSGQNYFVKLKGSAPLAQREKERFMKFVSSIRFDR